MQGDGRGEDLWSNQKVKEVLTEYKYFEKICEGILS